MPTLPNNRGYRSWSYMIWALLALTLTLTHATYAGISDEAEKPQEEEGDDPARCIGYVEGECGTTGCPYRINADDKAECEEKGGEWSDHPVRFANGRLKLRVTDLGSHLPRAFGHTRFFQNRNASSGHDEINGYNWAIAEHPRLAFVDNGNAGLDNGDQIIAYKGDNTPVWFDYDGTSFTARNDKKGRYQLQRLTGNDRISLWTKVADNAAALNEENVPDGYTVEHKYDGFRLTLGQGTGAEEITYFGFEQSDQSRFAMGGVFYRYEEPSGEFINTTTSYSYNKPLSLDRSIGGVLYSLSYDYYSAGAVDRLQHITLTEDDGSGATDVRRASYAYYASAGDHGTPNDLKTVTIQKPNGVGGWDDIEVAYYRYYTEAWADQDGKRGNPHIIQYALGPEGYRRMHVDSLDPLTAADSVLADYADFFFEFDSDNKVTKEVANASCGGCGGNGTEGESFVRTARDPDPTDDYNTWETKTEVTYADGSKQTVYTNYAGQPIVKLLEDGTDQWYRYYRYNNDGRLVLEASPSAVTGIDESKDDLVNYGAVSGRKLEQSEGFIEIRQYYPTTTATDTVAGGVDGYLQYIAVKNGEDGSEVRLREFAYLKFNQGGEELILDGEKTLYPDDSTTDTKIETTYAYTFHAGLPLIESVTTTLPAIAVSHNGSGTAATMVEFFDKQGRRTWTKGTRGVISFSSYDLATGRMLKRITDVDTTETGDFTDLPTGWSTPATSGFGNHVITEYVYDDLSRLVEAKGPSHDVDIAGTKKTVRTVSLTAYVENGPTALDEVRAGQAYLEGGTYTLINPVAIRKAGKKGRNTYETLTAKRTLGSGKDISTDAFTTRADWYSWTTNTYSDNGRLTAVRRYHDIPGTGDGTEGTNFDETTLAYDDDRQIKTQSPDGTITRTVYATVNGMDIAESVWAAPTIPVPRPLIRPAAGRAATT